MEPLLGQWISKRYGLITVSLGDLCLCSMHFGFYLLTPVHLALYAVRLSQRVISSQCSGHSLHLPQMMQMLCNVQRAIHESFRVGGAQIESDFSRATRESRESAGMKRLYLWCMDQKPYQIINSPGLSTFSLSPELPLEDGDGPRGSDF